MDNLVDHKIYTKSSDEYVTTLKADKVVLYGLRMQFFRKSRPIEYYLTPSMYHVPGMFE